MNSLKNLALVACASIILLSSCAKAKLNDASTAIPKDALSVTAFNIKNLMQKADFEAVKKMAFYQEGLKDMTQENPALAEIMKNPEKSGIDLNKNIYITQDVNIGNSMSPSQSYTLLMSLSNIADFEAMLKAGQLGNVEKKDGVSFINIKKETSETDENGYTISSNMNSTVAWKDNLAVLTTGNTEGGSFSQYFKTKTEESIVKNEHFNKVMAQSHDIYSYMSFDKYAKEMQGAAALMNIDPKALTGNYFTSYGDFEKGQIVSKSDFNINKLLTKQWGIMFKDNVKTDFSKYINGKELGFAMSLGLDMKGIKEIINSSPQFRMTAEMAKGTTEFSIDDLCKALDGDMVIAAKPKGNDWDGVMGFKVADKAAIKKMLDILSQKEVIIKVSDEEYTISKTFENMSSNYIGENGKLHLKDDILFVGSNEAMSHMASGGNLKSEAKEVLNKHIFGLYADFGTVFNNKEEFKDPELKELMMTINSKNGDTLIKTKDSNENSLKSLMKALDRWYQKNKKEAVEKPVETAEREDI